MKSAARPLIAATKSRYYSVAATAKAVKHHEPKIGKSVSGPQVSRMNNGILVATVENHSPLSHIAIVYNGGSRYETVENRGITHCLRTIANNTSAQASVFGFIRNIQQIGGTSLSTTTREHKSLSLTCTRDKVTKGFEFLGHVTSEPLFFPWETKDLKQYIDLDLALLKQRHDIKLIEALHSAAYRQGGLGNSLYMDDTLVGSHKSDMLKNFHSSHVLSGNVAVVGVGIEHKVLQEAVRVYAKEIPEGQAAKPVQSKYIGGEVRHNIPNLGLVHAAIATEGFSIDSKESSAAAVLQAILGGNSCISYLDNNNTSRISAAVDKAASNPAAGVCLNVNYSDNGLFGLKVVAAPKDIRNVLNSVMESFGSSNITESDLKRGKARALSDLYMSRESGEVIMELLAADVLRTGEARSEQQLIADLEAVTLADVKAVAKKVSGGKLSMAAVGDLHDTPYLDELK